MKTSVVYFLLWSRTHQSDLFLVYPLVCKSSQMHTMYCIVSTQPSQNRQSGFVLFPILVLWYFTFLLDHLSFASFLLRLSVSTRFFPEDSLGRSAISWPGPMSDCLAPNFARSSPISFPLIPLCPRHTEQLNLQCSARIFQFSLRYFIYYSVAFLILPHFGPRCA